MHLTFDSLSVQITTSPTSDGCEIHVHISIDDAELLKLQELTKDSIPMEPPTEDLTLSSMAS